ncbi:Actin-related protein - Arp5p, partial [Pseudoloma neurophilia]
MNYDVVEGTIDSCLRDFNVKNTINMIFTVGLSTPRIIKKDLLEILMEIYNINTLQLGIDSIYAYLHNQARFSQNERNGFDQNTHDGFDQNERFDQNTNNGFNEKFTEKPRKTSKKSSNEKSFNEKPSNENVIIISASHTETHLINLTTRSCQNFPFGGERVRQYLNAMNFKSKEVGQFKLKVAEISYRQTCDEILDGLKNQKLKKLEIISTGRSSDGQKSEIKNSTVAKKTGSTLITESVTGFTECTTEFDEGTVEST